MEWAPTVHTFTSPVSQVGIERLGFEFPNEPYAGHFTELGANLFANLDAGAGTQLWVCGGGRALGKHCAAWGTYWNIRADRALSWPPDRFGPDLMNLVGLNTGESSVRQPEGRWFEAIPPKQLRPQNIWQAQRSRRLKK